MKKILAPTHAALLILLCLFSLFAVPGPVGAENTVRIQPPANVGQAVHSARQYHDSGAYRADLEAVGQAALKLLIRRMAEAGLTKPVIVLDVDETSLSNWQEMDRLNLGYNREDWTAWAESGRAPAVAPTLALAREADRLGAGIVFITGRSETMRTATEQNLKSVGYPAWTELIMRPEGDRRTANIYKTGARSLLEKKGYTILLNMGDQESDLVGGYSEAVFKLPNPFYLIPVGY